MKVKKEINLLPQFVIKQKNELKRIIIITITTIALTLFGFAIYYTPQLKLLSLSVKLKGVNEEIEFMSDAKQLKDKLDSTQAILDKKNGILKEIDADDVDIVPLLDKLTKATPENVRLSFLNVNGKNDISADYVIHNPIELNDLINNLKKLDIFKDVQTPNVPITDRQTDVAFKLQLK